jgi:hypothetical protein
MPKRTNLFQEVVAIIGRHLLPGTEITESDELIDHDTGEEREVDVTVRGTVDGVQVLVGIEAADRSRPADSIWVEQQIAKHQAVGTDLLVLVAARGFYGPALRKAQAHDVVTIAPEDLEDDHELAIMAKLTGALATAEPTITAVAIGVRIPPGGAMTGDPAVAYRADGTPANTDQIAAAILDQRFPDVIAKVTQDLTRTHQRKLVIQQPPTEALFAKVQVDGNAEQQTLPVERVDVDITVDVQLHPKMRLLAKLFGQTPTLYGESKLGEDQMIFVSTEHEGQTRSTLRTRAPGQAVPDDWIFDGVVDIEPDQA